MHAPVQHRAIAGGEREWALDVAAAAAAAPWAARAPDLLAAEAAEMAEHFPHWLLTAGPAGRPAPCPACGDLLVFAAGSARCVACWRPAAPPAGGELIWLGHLPALVRPAPALAARLPDLAAAGFPTVAAGEGRYLLAPIRLSYPAAWPHAEPEARYPLALLELLGLPAGVSSATHMLGDGRACLYAHGQYRGASARAVIQQRLVNHLASLLKIAAGVPPAEAFIGRIH